MLDLILGTDWTANRRRIMELIAGDIQKKQGGRILMVPELISHDTERRLCESAGATASRYAEVLSFTRLARRVADYAGVGMEACLDDGGRVVAMAAAARALHSQLKAYASVETKPEFLTGLVDAVDEFKRCCITAGDLKQAAEQSHGGLAQKLEELSLLLDAYDGLCAGGKRDPRDQETVLLEQLEDCDFAENHIFYIDGFPDFTRQHLAILEHLIRFSPRVTVSVNCDKPDSTAMAFEKAGATASELIRCAQRAGVEIRIETVEPSPGPLQAMREKLFQGKIQAQDEQENALTVVMADSVHDECTAAAERVMELVRGGCRYRDISVVCADMAAYQNMVDLVFHSCQIPLYRSGTEDILQRSVISSILYALDAALDGFDQREVLRYLRSPLSNLELDAFDRMENYAILWGIRGGKWLEPWENHPDGLGEPWNDDSRARLAALEADRVRTMGPLMRLRDGFSRARALGGQVEAIYRFFEEIALAEHLAQLADQLDDEGDNRSAQVLNQLWEILLTALEQLYDVLGKTSWDTQSFLRLFTLLLSQYDVGTIPPVLDAVMVGPVNAMRCQEPKHLIVLGAQEGSLPGYGGSTGVLTDQERTALRQMGVPLTGGAMEGIQAEFSEIYGVFCGARETVWVSCASEQPSFVYRRLAQMAGGAVHCQTLLGPALASRDNAGAFLAQHRDAQAARALEAMDAYENICVRTAYGLGSVSREHIRGLYGAKLNLSASQVDRHAECRLSYFLKYGLRAKERKEATIDPAEFGTFVHAVLEKTGRRVMELGGFHQVCLEQTLELANGYAAAYAKERFDQLDSQRLDFLFRRNGQELELVVRELWQELKESAFQPLDFETAFGEQGKLDAIQIPGGTMDAQLRGFVDRVDTWTEMGRNYFRVVDYKTGKKDFDYCDVFNGIGLQMLLYLFALEQEGSAVLGDHAIPAGVLYFPARAPLIRAEGKLTDEEAQNARQKEWKRKGLLLDDQDVLLAMEPEEPPKRLCYTTNKKGVRSGDLADREQLKLLRKFVFKVLGAMVDEIASGNVEPNPYTRGTSHDACRFCPYGAVCHKLQVEGRRNYQAMKADKFWEEIGKEMDSHG